MRGFDNWNTKRCHPGAPELLFYKYDMHNVMDGQRSQIAKRVQGERAGNALLNTPTDDLVARIEKELRLEVPVIHIDQAHADQYEGQVEVFDTYGAVFGEGPLGERGGSIVQGTIIELHVPFSGDKTFFYVRPTNFDSAPPRVIVSNDLIVLRHAGRGLNAEQVKKGI